MKILSLLPPGLLLPAGLFSIGHFLCRIFVMKEASSRMPAISMSLMLETAINDQLQY
jgi:hypothetical protein